MTMLSIPTRHCLVSLFSIAVFLFAVPASAQTVTGTISGTVVDNSGAVIVRGEVTLVDAATGAMRRAPTDETGGFVFAGVPPGTYTTKIQVKGFRTFERTGIVLTANERLALGRIEMSVGELTEAVTVAAQGSNVNTEGADSTAMISSSQLRDVMIRGLDITNLVRILPGVSQIVGGADSLGGRYGSFMPNINGTRAYSTNIQLDGQASNDVDILNAVSAATSVNAMAEVQVVMNTYLPEYGGGSGATVNMVTKSGARDFHGSGYWYLRNEALNAQDFFANYGSLRKPVYRYNTFGFTLGGPIYVPNRFNRNRNRLFFFYSQEEWRTKIPQALLSFTLPTALERQGNFSQSLDQNNKLITITDPTTHQPFPGNAIPLTQINANGQKLLSVFPMPNQLNRSITQGAYNYQFQDMQDVPKRGQLLRLDYRPTDKDTITLRPKRWWADTRAYTNLAGFYGVPLVYYHYKYSHSAANADWTHIISPTMVNEFTAGFWGAHEGGTPERANEFDAGERTTYGITLGQFHPELNPYNFLPEMTFGGLPNAASFTMDSRNPIDCGDHVLQISNNLSVIRSGHTFKFGLYIQRNWVTEGLRGTNFAGVFDFSNDVNNPLSAGSPFATAILGNFTSYTEAAGKARALGKRQMVEWYAQDTWKVNRKLTLTYGMRFSWFTPYQLRIGDGSELAMERYDFSKVPRFYRPAFDPSGKRSGYDAITGVYMPAVLIGAFVPGTGDPFNGTVAGTDHTYPNGFRIQQAVQPAPRFGFAYDVFGNAKTAIRGGFGISKRANESSGAYTGNMAASPPLVYRPQIYYGKMDTFLGASSVLFPGNVQSWQKNDVVPSIYNYSFGIQQNMGFATILDVSYVGNVGRHLAQTVNLNQLPYGVRFLPQNADPTNPSLALPDSFLRPYPGYGNISYVETSGTSNYNALQVTANRRFARGVQFGLAYSYSKAMGLTSGEAGSVSRYVADKVWSYAPLDFSQTHMLVVNYLWDLPKASKLWANAVIRHAFDDWHLSGISTFGTGTPLGITVTTTDNADITGGGDGVRAVMVAAAQLSHGDRNFYHWFNTASVARPAKGTFGNAARAVLWGPGVNNWDATLMKNFPLRSESRFFRIRWELYNMFNHTQFNGVNTTARFDPTGNQVNGQFGWITSTRSPRIMQLSLSLQF
jgi:Carboxypeptidase regulatory-like domain